MNRELKLQYEKLIASIVVLVVALVILAGLTFSWFTMNSEVSTNGITLRAEDMLNIYGAAYKNDIPDEILYTQPSFTMDRLLIPGDVQHVLLYLDEALSEANTIEILMDLDASTQLSSFLQIMPPEVKGVASKNLNGNALNLTLGDTVAVEAQVLDNNKIVLSLPANASDLIGYHIDIPLWFKDNTNNQNSLKEEELNITCTVKRGDEQ